MIIGTAGAACELLLHVVRSGSLVKMNRAAPSSRCWADGRVDAKVSCAGTTVAVCFICQAICNVLAVTVEEHLTLFTALFFTSNLLALSNVLFIYFDAENGLPQPPHVRAGEAERRN